MKTIHKLFLLTMSSCIFPTFLSTLFIFHKDSKRLIIKIKSDNFLSMQTRENYREQVKQVQKHNFNSSAV